METGDEVERDLLPSLPPGWRLLGFAVALALLALLCLQPGQAHAAGPSVTINSGPEDPTPTNDSTPTFGFTSTDPLASTQCSVDNDTFASCTSPYTTAELGDGPHTLEVVATDVLGTPGDVASRAFTIDTTAPVASIDSGPKDPTPTNDDTPTFGLSSNEAGSTFQCRVDSDAFATCSASFTTTRLTDGTHTLDVVATDPAGNPSQQVSQTFTIDTTAPGVSIDSGPQDPTPTNDSTPTFGFSSPEAGATFQCRVDGGSFASCTSPFTTAALADGPHSLEVVALDSLGHQSTSDSRSFTVDTAAPDGQITAGPRGTIGTRTPTFTFASEPGASFRCKLDGASWGPCTSPRTLGPLADGPHTFAVAARDTAGNGDPTPAAATFVVDTGAPETVIVSGPPASSGDTTPSFAFASNEAGARFECSLDHAAFAPCTSPRTVGPLAPGSHTFSVRARDAAGHVDASPATLAFTIVVASAPNQPGSSGTGVPVAVLATRFAEDIGAVAKSLGTTELPAIVRRRGIRAGALDALVPGTARIRVTARSRGKRITVLRGARRFAAEGKGSMRLKLTRAGRRLLRRARKVRMNVAYTFTAKSGIRIAASARATVWRRWLTLGEVARVARRWIPRYFDSRAKSLTLDRCSRRGPVYMRCSDVSWIKRGKLWHVRLRVRQVGSRFRQNMSDAWY